MHSISDIFIQIKDTMISEQVSIDDLLEAFHERGFGFLLLILSVPMALPVPVPPGINVLLASPLILLTAQQAVGRHTIWLPRWIRRKTIKGETLHKVIDACLPWCKRIEIVVRPRMECVTHGVFSLLIGVFGLIMALAICVPFPMTNTVPSIGIAMMAIGVIMRDGLAVLGGAVIGLLWVSLLGAGVIFLGTEGIDAVKGVIKGYF